MPLDLDDPLDRKVAAEFLVWNQNRTTGEGLTFLRDELGLTRDELAVRLGVAPQQVYAWEDAKYKPMPIEQDRAIRAMFH